MFVKYNQQINQILNEAPSLKPAIDYEKVRAKRLQRDINLLFDKSSFIKEIKSIFSDENITTIDRETLRDIENRSFWHERIYSDLVFLTLENTIHTESMSLNDILNIINNTDWDNFCIGKIYNYLKQGTIKTSKDLDIKANDVAFSQNQENWIKNWCLRHYDKIDFKTAIETHDDHSYTLVEEKANYLRYFLEKFDLEYSRSVYLDMLSFAWDGSGIKYLESKLSKEEITERILDNLEEGIKNHQVLLNHLNFCREENVKEAIPFASKVVIDSNSFQSTREAALGVIAKLSGTLKELEQILPQIKDEFRWIVIRQLFESKSGNLRNFLFKILENEEETEKIKAADFLIRFQDLRGLKFYTEWIRKNKQFPDTEYGSSPLLDLRTIEALPYLFEILELSYEISESDEIFERLDHVVLNAFSEITLHSNQDKNYREIKNAIEDFINRKREKYEKVKYLYIFLERLEKRYYVSKGENQTIDKALNTLQNINL